MIHFHAADAEFMVQETAKTAREAADALEDANKRSTDAYNKRQEKVTAVQTAITGIET